MWSPARIIDVMQMRPFLPFRVHMANGHEHAVTHPEMAAVFPKERVMIVTEEGTVHMLDILMITAIEFRRERSMEEIMARMRRR